MALWKTKQPNHRHNSHNGRRRVIIIEEPAGLPPSMKKLRLVCKRLDRHPLPCSMSFIAESTSHASQAMAVYACDSHGCNWREGWIQDHRTRQPRRLWAGFHDGR